MFDECLFFYTRAHEPIRLLSLQFIGRLLVGVPSEKKGLKIFNLAVGRSKSLSEINRRTNSRVQPIINAISERLFSFPLTEHLCATLFDALLGGASPKQVTVCCNFFVFHVSGILLLVDCYVWIEFVGVTEASSA